MTPQEFFAAAAIPEPVQTRLLRYDETLMDWQARHNLISKGTIDVRWDRHFRDSAQLAALLPKGAKRLVDLGSGAGFPALVLAAIKADDGLQVTMVESIAKKADFLKAAADAMGLANHTVLRARIEQARVGPADVITARALAPLHKLCGYAHGIADKKTVCLFPKGARAEEELTEADKSWRMEVIRHQSATDDSATIFEITDIVPRKPDVASRA